MRRLHKIISSAVLACLLFCLSGNGNKCHAQGYPTMDIMNFLEQVLGYIQDSEIAGLFSDMSDLDMKIEKFQQWKEVFDKGMKVVGMITSGIRLGTEIYETATFFSNETMYMMDCITWFNQHGASPGIALAAMNCLSEFKDFYNAILSDKDEIMKFVNESKSGDGVQTIRFVEQVLKEFKMQFYQVVVHFRGEMNKLYNLHMQAEAIAANAAFMNNYYLY